MPHPAHTRPLVRGVFAALTIPRSPRGELDVPAFRRHISFLAEKGISGFALNGATGEYCLTSAADLARMLKTAREVLGSAATLLAGIGGTSSIHCQQMLDIAQQECADGVLLPMPHYFPYSQQDLVAFVEDMAAKASIPILLYNLPSFTSPIEPATAVSLIRYLHQLVGIKDSSGQLDTVLLLTEELPGANRIIGNDDVLYEALKRRLCDGVVSGVACVLPELMVSLYEAVKTNAANAESLHLRGMLDEVITWLGRFPVPWGLKIIAEERGLGPAIFPMPLSTTRAADRRLFVEWFTQHRAALLVNSTVKAGERKGNLETSVADGRC